MKCSICHKEIKLIPSAEERADKYGGKPTDYTKLFTTHADCFIKQRELDTKNLIQKINGKV